MILLELFISFVKIGFTSFGGMSMVPLIMEEMGAHGWMSTEDLTNLIAIAEMTPGPLGINCATFAGTQTAGFIGGLIAVAGVLSPSFTLALIAAVFYAKFSSSKVLASILSVVKPVSIGMVLSVIISLALTSYGTNGNIDITATLLGLLLCYLRVWKKVSVIKILLIAATLGFILFYCCKL
jgi:chromate transporter